VELKQAFADGTSKIKSTATALQSESKSKCFQSESESS